MRATEAIIDLKKLKHNALFLQKKARGREMMGILKADAYGHGAVTVMETLIEIGWRHFGVATIEEALELREANAEAEIFLLGAVSSEDFPLCVEKALAFPVHDRVSLEAALALKGSAKIHIKVDTGMHRLGFTPAQLHEHFEEISSLEPVGIYTHLARSEEEDKSSALSQVAQFQAIVEELVEKGLSFEWIHYANSGALMEMELSFSNMVRAGVVLYGFSPGESLHPELLPIMSLKSRILAVREIEAGEGVSYGHTFVAQRPMRLATVPIGYADGYKRKMSGRIASWIDGKECPQLGRITMDQTIFDVTDTQARVGDVVELMGEHIHCDRLCEAAETIKAEFVATLGKRVRRVYQK